MAKLTVAATDREARLERESDPCRLRRLTFNGERVAPWLRRMRERTN